jgi:hypothetical protein
MCSHKNKKENTNRRTKNSGNIGGSNWINIKTATTRVDLYYIWFVVTTIVTSHIKIVVTWVDNNISPNKFTIDNKGTIRAILNSKYNKKSSIYSIWSIVGTKKSNYSTDRSNYSISKSTLYFLFIK